MRGTPLLARVLVAFAAVACGKTLEIEDAPDAASTDAAAPGNVDAGSSAGDAASADGDAGALPNLHPNGTFDTTCSPWTSFQGTASHVPSDGRTSAGACRFCTNGSSSYFTADDTGILGAPVVGGEYEARVWVRAADSTALPSKVSLGLRTRDASKTEVQDGYVELATPLSTTWQMLTAKLLVTQPAKELAVVVGATPVEDSCFLLDDVTVVRIR